MALSSTASGQGGSFSGLEYDSGNRSGLTQSSGGPGIHVGMNEDDKRSPVNFVEHLKELDVPLWVAPAGGNEFVRPRGWQKLTSDDNTERVETFKSGMALCANMGGVMAVVDVDPRNGGDSVKMRTLLAGLKVRVFAEITSPSGGKHFYIAGHPDLPSVHGKIPGFPGVDIQSFGTNVFLPGTQRGKYDGKGYVIVFDDLKALAASGDSAGAETFVQWVAKRLQEHTEQKTKTSGKPIKPDLDFEPAPRWCGGVPDARQLAYLDRVLEENANSVAEADSGTRNDALFSGAMKCASFIAGAGMDEQRVVQRFVEAATNCGLVDDDGERAVLATINSAFRVGLSNPRAVPDEKASRGSGRQRDIEWVSLENIEDAAPKWAWYYGGQGRIQVATLTLFAGRPGTGKSTAARHFVARLTKGGLDGCWKGRPQNVAYIAAEETAKYVVKPALRAAKADMGRVFIPKVKIADGQNAPILAAADERAMTDYFIKQKVTVIVVDPVMSTFGKSVDIYRSNELRDALGPWVRIAEAIDGIVIGIVHFVKGSTGDLVGNINGSSAFGEVARAVFAFAREDSSSGDPRGVMTQAKNSCGRAGLSFEYSIESEWVKVSNGDKVEVATFVLGDESDVSASDILKARKVGPLPLSPQMQRVLDYVGSREGPVSPIEVSQAGLANNNKLAGQMLARLFNRGLILKLGQGEYQQLPVSSCDDEQLRKKLIPKEMKK